MNNQSTLYAVIGILAGVLIGIFVSSYAVNNNMTGMMRMMGLNGQYNRMMGEDSLDGVDDTGRGGMMGMGSSMDEMMQSMEGKTGDDLDQAFLSAMMTHHQGAIKMAEKVKGATKRPELMKMADDIIKAQTSEVEMMRQWQKEWFK